LLGPGQYREEQSQCELAQADLARYKPLLDKGEISKQQYDAAKANADATASALRADQKAGAGAARGGYRESAVNCSRCACRASQSGRLLSARRCRQISMRTSDAQGKIAKVQSARASLAAAELNLSYTEVVAPVDGVATHKQVEPGQIVQQGQDYSCRAAADVWVTANFKETQLRKMRAGQKAYVHVTLTEKLPRSSGLHCRSDWRCIEFVAAGKCHRQLLKVCSVFP